MPKTHFPRAGGNRWVDSFYHLDKGAEATTGDVWYVNSATGTDAAGNGRSPDAPLATIAYAVGTAATASQGDVVYVMPGHTETITGAAGVAMSKAGVKVKGIGWGRNRPRVNYTTAVGASWDITAANCWVENLYFTGTGVDNVTAMVNVQAADCVIRNCEFEHADATNQAALVILTNASADRLRIEDNVFHGSNNAGTSAAISMVGGDSIVIRNNVISGAYHASNGVIKNATTDSTNLQILGNYVQNLTGANTKAVVLTATSTGMIANNSFQILSGTSPITGAAMSDLNNTYSNTIATSTSIEAVEQALFGAGGVATWPAAVTPANTSSIAGVLREIYNNITGADGIGTFPAAAAAANNVSVAEVLRYVQDRVTAQMLNRNSTNYLSVVADFTSATWNTAASHEILTVTGACHVIILPQVTGTITSAGGMATLVLGDETTSNSIIASTDAENLAAGEWWFDNTDTRTLAARSIFEKTDVVIGNGKDIGYTIGTEPLTGGSITFHVWWEPIDATGAVAAGAGGAL